MEKRKEVLKMEKSRPANVYEAATLATQSRRESRRGRERLGPQPFRLNLDQLRPSDPYEASVMADVVKALSARYKETPRGVL